MDPLQEVENAHAVNGMGRFAVQVYRGARSEAENWREAFWATVAFLIAVSKQEPDDE